MKITLGLGHREYVDKGRNATEADVTSTASQYALKLTAEFLKRGIEVEYYHLLGATRQSEINLAEDNKSAKYYSENPPKSTDHFISLEQSGFAWRHPCLLETIRNSCRGKITTICDHDLQIGEEDLVFHARLGKNNSDKAVYVGWGADEEFFYPAKDDETLTIFIDHKYYFEKEFDQTEEILEEVCIFFSSYDFTKLPGKKNKVEIIFLGPSGIEFIDPKNPPIYIFDADRSRYTKRIPINELVHWYRRADIFIVTHRETMGQPVLESAMCGALVVAQQNFIEPELLKPLSHIEYQDQIPWEKIFLSLDINTARERALNFTWSKVADKMLNALVEPKETNVNPEKNRFPTIEFTADHIRISSHMANSGLETFSHLSSWSKNHASINEIQGHGIYKRYEISSTKDLGFHYVHTKVDKLPKQQCYSLSFFVPKPQINFIKISAFGARQNDRAFASFDLQNCKVTGNHQSWFWEMRNTKIIKIDSDKFWCFMVFRTDYSNTLGVIIQPLVNPEDGVYDGVENKLQLYGLRLEEGELPLCLDF